ncbi:hypothetical protein M513_12901 [Trichuris suis]|uniref:Uncharacterized protein n=1 Tax=Trichuris suis TaxID=68888 RepID=A0A085LMK5_9BILA|nr:hypothetical protein M513_12901 [Trichuris suis]
MLLPLRDYPLPSAIKSVQVQMYFATLLLRTQRDKSTKCLDCKKRCDFACCWKLLEDGVRLRFCGNRNLIS